MNTYGQQAMTHWQRWLPQRYAAISDPETFFAELGEQAAAQIVELADQLAGTDPPGETYLDKLGRLNAARHAAQEMVVRELILPAPDPDETSPETSTQTSPETSPETSRSSTASGEGGDWIPVVEDPTHPYWADQER